MKCPNCNAVISPHAKRCEYCGEYFLGNESVEAPAEEEYQLCFDPGCYEPYMTKRDEHGQLTRHNEIIMPPPILLKH